MKTHSVVKILKSGGVGVMPTDTIYGLVGNALLPQTVERIYQLRERDQDKPMIILISSIKNLSLFKIKINRRLKLILENLWPGKVSIILPCPEERFSYLHRGGKTLAFRYPAKPSLVKILKRTGPLVAPSANPQGQPPAANLAAARKYFGDQVDFYLAGRVSSLPSTLVAWENDQLVVKREGAVKIKNLF